MAKNIGTDFTEGSILRKMIAFSIPYILSSALQVVYSMVDMIIVGHFVGGYALSAISISSQYILFCTALCIGYSGGGQTYISQLLGGKRRDKLNDAIGTLFCVILGASIILSVATVILRPQLLSWMNAPAESYNMARDYLTICGGGMFFIYGYNLVSSVLRGMGDSKKPFLFIGIATIVNTVLDLLFVGVLKWSVAGAAWATLIGQAVSFVASLIYLYRRKESFGFDFKPSSFRIDRSAVSGINKIGIVMCLQTGMVNFSMMFINSQVNSMGVVASAAFGVGVKIDDLINKGTFGFHVANLTIIGQNYAAHKNDRVRKSVFTTWSIVGVLYLIFATLYFFFYKQLFGCFTDDAQIIALAPVYVSAILWSFPGYVLMRGTTGVTQGTGFAKLAFATSFFDAIFIRIGLSYVLGRVCGLGLYGFFLGYALAVYGTAVPNTIYFISGKWKNRKLLFEEK